jgi:hypothetical protein
MRYASQSGQHPDQVVEACINQVRRAIKRPQTRIAILEALRPYTRGTGHSDMNGDQIATAIHAMVRGITFYREPAGAAYPGEVIQSPTLTIELNGGDCDDLAVVAATAASVLGCEAAIGWYPTSSDGRQAHIVAAIRPGWYQGRQWVVIDAQQKKPTDSATVSGVRWLRV